MYCATSRNKYTQYNRRRRVRFNHAQGVFTHNSPALKGFSLYVKQMSEYYTKKSIKLQICIRIKYSMYHTNMYHQKIWSIFRHTRPSCLPHGQPRLGARKQPVLAPGSLPASEGRHSSAPGPAGCRVLIRVPWPARSPCHLHAELGRPEYCLADRSSRPRDEIEVVQVGLLCRLGTSPGLGQMPRQLNARLAVLQVDRLRRHVRLRQQGR